MAVGALETPAARHVVGVALLALGIAHQEQDRRHSPEAPYRTASPNAARTHGLHEVRRDDDDEVGLALLEVGGAEESADHRHIADPGELVDALRVLRLQQACDREALSVAQFDGGMGFALGQ